MCMLKKKRFLFKRKAVAKFTSVSFIVLKRKIIKLVFVYLTPKRMIHAEEEIITEPFECEENLACCIC
jgi:hypothetical protein